MDNQETKKFINDMVGIMPFEQFADEILEGIFNKFDTNGSGTVEKDEMIYFLKQSLVSKQTN
jgi:hypothetical protein